MQRRSPVALSLGFLMGCTRETMVVPPEALPALAESQAVAYTRTRDGQRVVEQGPIRWVMVHRRPDASTQEADPHDAPRVEGFRAPFQATLAGVELRVSDEDRKSVVPLRDIERVDVQYDARAGSASAAMRIVGIVLTSLGSASLVGGVALMAVVANQRASSLALWVGGVPTVMVSTVLAGIGIPLWVTGARRAGAVPTLVPTGTGAEVRWAF